MAAVSSDHFSGLFDKHSRKLEVWRENPHVETLENAAVNFEKSKDTGKVQAVKEKALEILEAQRLAKVTAEVLQGLKRSYVASDAATDFATLLREGVDEQQAASRWSAANESAYIALEEAIRDEGGVTQPATQNNDDEDEDEVRVEPGQKGLAPNETCPLSGRALMDIEEPVQDAKGFVYEKTAIVQYIRRAPGPSAYIECPVYGANHKLAENDLKPAKRIIKAQRKHKRNPAGRSQTQHPDSVMIDI